MCAWIDRKQLWLKISHNFGICHDDPSLDLEKCRYLGGFVLKPGEEVEPEWEIE